MNTKTCIVVVGPTAVGKTDFAIRLARHFDTDIISADSRQCFIELNIGVSKPSASQLKEIKHFFINSHHIQEEVNAAVFETLSLQYCKEIFKEHDHAIMVGGTGLYVKAFTSGLDEIPPSSSSVRKTISEQYKSNGLEWLQQQLKMHDPIFLKKGKHKTRNA
jgi:tRNA dimethylallyltransferase